MAKSSQDVHDPVGCMNCVFACPFTVKGSTAHLQHALQLLVDWLKYQLDLLMPPRPLARQIDPSPREHCHRAAA